MVLPCRRFISWYTLQGLLCSIHTAAPSPQKWSVTPTRLLFEAIKDRDLMCCKRVLLGADCLPELRNELEDCHGLPANWAIDKMWQLEGMILALSLPRFVLEQTVLVPQQAVAFDDNVPRTDT